MKSACRLLVFAVVLLASSTSVSGDYCDRSSCPTDVPILAMYEGVGCKQSSIQGFQIPYAASTLNACSGTNSINLTTEGIWSYYYAYSPCVEYTGFQLVRYGVCASYPNSNSSIAYFASVVDSDTFVAPDYTSYAGQYLNRYVQDCTSETNCTFNGVEPVATTAVYTDVGCSEANYVSTQGIYNYTQGTCYAGNGGNYRYDCHNNFTTESYFTGPCDGNPIQVTGSINWCYDWAGSSSTMSAQTFCVANSIPPPTAGSPPASGTPTSSVTGGNNSSLWWIILVSVVGGLVLVGVVAGILVFALRRRSSQSPSEGVPLQSM